jgi:hypothetical protein
MRVVASIGKKVSATAIKAGISEAICLYWFAALSRAPMWFGGLEIV